MDVEKLFQSFADEFMTGNHLAFANSFMHPLIVYSPIEIRIERTVEDTLCALSDRLASARMAGATSVRSSAQAENVASTGRHPVNVTWTFFTDQNVQCGTSNARYYVRTKPGQAPKIELIEILESTIHTPAPRYFAEARH